MITRKLLLVLSSFFHHWQSCRNVQAFVPARQVLIGRDQSQRQQRQDLIARTIDPWNDDRSIPIIIDGIDVTKVPTTTLSVTTSFNETVQQQAIVQEQVRQQQPTLLNNKSDDADDDDDDSSLWISNPQFAVVLLNLVAILWGTQHAVIKSVVTDTAASAAVFTLCRFALAAVVALPAGLAETITTRTTTEISKNYQVIDDDKDDSLDYTRLARWGAEMGFWMFLGFAFQAIGLATTTAQKSGFLLYLNVKLVPLFAWMGYGRQISSATWISAATAVVGTSLMGGLFVVGATDESSSLTAAQRWNVGDVWSIAAAAASAMFILRLESASRSLPNHAAALNAASLVVVTTLAVWWTAAVNPQLDWNDVSNVFTSHVWEFVYLGGVTTAAANWIQTSAQRYVSAERASLIYAMDPIYGAIFSYLWLGEALPGVAGWIGATLITIAAASNAFLELDKMQQTPSTNKGESSS